MEDFIKARSLGNRVKIMTFLTLLEERGPNLPRPYADLLKDGIHELRIRLSGDQIRILYFFCYRNYIVLTRAFMKTSERVPTHEIENARKCRSDFLNRYSK
ncbi:MAG TPA: type II toxin-antitoxin system RelE/ParE family toxin [bacterium]|nr:type II toxin-antitoxin system RelE/ParE family toxin [bacterium]